MYYHWLYIFIIHSVSYPCKKLTENHKCPRSHSENVPSMCHCIYWWNIKCVTVYLRSFVQFPLPERRYLCGTADLLLSVWLCWATM